MSLVSLVDDQRQFFKSSTGLAEPWASARGTALSHSFCWHVVAADAPLVVTDARTDTRVSANPAIDDLGVVAYLGAPVHGPGGAPIGSLCAISQEPRAWTEDDSLLLVDLAAALSELIALRTAAVERRAAVIELSHHLRTGLTALRLEVEEAEGLVEDGAREVLQRLSGRIEGDFDELTAALGVLEQGALGHESVVDLVEALEQLANDVPGNRVVIDASGELPSTARVVTAEAELRRVLRSVADVLLEHGRGDVRVGVQVSSSSVRVRLQDDGEGLPLEAARFLTGRTDGGGDAGSLAQRAARGLGARLVLVSSRPNTVDLLLPRRHG